MRQKKGRSALNEAWQKKIGRTPIQRLEWLLRFAQSDIPLSEKKLEELDGDIEAFVLVDSGVEGMEGSARSAVAISQIRDEVLQNLRLVANWDPKVLGNAGWWVPLDGLGRFVRRGFASGYVGGRDSRRQAFMAIAADLVASTDGLRVHECGRSSCDRLFIKRKRGLYCSRTCSQREQTRKYQDRIRQMRRRWAAGGFKKGGSTK